PPRNPPPIRRGAQGSLRPWNPSAPHLPRPRDARDPDHGRCDEPDPPLVPKYDTRGTQHDPELRLRTPVLGMRTPDHDGHQRNAPVLCHELLQLSRRAAGCPGRLELGHPGKRPRRARAAARHGPRRRVSKADRDRASVARFALAPIGRDPAGSFLSDEGPTLTHVPLALRSEEHTSELQSP